MRSQKKIWWSFLDKEVLEVYTLQIGPSGIGIVDIYHTSYRNMRLVCNIV